MSREDYSHWNEDADMMWWLEEGQFGNEPIEPDFDLDDAWDDYDDEDEDYDSFDDREALASAGWGTDEDYGYFGGDDFYGE